MVVFVHSKRQNEIPVYLITYVTHFMGLFVCNVANEYGETEKEMWGLKTENRGQQCWVLDTTCINSDVKWFSCVPINPSHANGIMPVLQLSQDKGEISSIALTFDLFQSKKTQTCQTWQIPAGLKCCLLSVMTIRGALPALLIWLERSLWQRETSRQ